MNLVFVTFYSHQLRRTGGSSNHIFPITSLTNSSKNLSDDQGRALYGNLLENTQNDKLSIGTMKQIGEKYDMSNKKVCKI